MYAEDVTRMEVSEAKELSRVTKRPLIQTVLNGAHLNVSIKIEVSVVLFPEYNVIDLYSCKSEYSPVEFLHRKKDIIETGNIDSSRGRI